MRAGPRVGRAEREQLGGERGDAVDPALELHAQDRLCRPRGADADQRRPAHGRVQVEDLLARHAVHRAVRGVHDVRLAPGEPQAALVVLAREVAHAVGDDAVPGAAWRRRSPRAGRRTPG